MTWLWRISFSLGCLAPLWATNVSGSVVLADSRDPSVRRHKDFSGVVVWLEPAGGSRAPSGSPPGRVQMAQINKHFKPHVLAIPVGAVVDFPNYDPIFHNAFSSYDGQVFDVHLYPPGSSRSVAFKTPGIVRVFCNIHPTMSAVIAVLQTPWFAVSRNSGDWEIHGVPPGEYEVHVFHERATEETLQALERRVTIAGGEHVSLTPFTVSEAGYIPAPHKDKYGKDYPPPGGYPAAQ
jgi:plastocyanin